MLSVTQESLTMASLKPCKMTYTGSMWQIKSGINWVSSCTDVSMARLRGISSAVAHQSLMLQAGNVSGQPHIKYGGATTPAFHCWPASIRYAGSDNLELFA